MTMRSLPLLSCAVLALLARSGHGQTAGAPVDDTLEELVWGPCQDNTLNTFCTDLYFCAGIWETLTTAPKPASASAGFAYSYRSNKTMACVPGKAPIMRMKPGNIYKVTLHNTADMQPGQIDPNSTLGMSMTTAWDSGWAYWAYLNMPLHATNLHLHGMHISGQGDHDNALRIVLPGQCLTYQYNIPVDLPGGTHWYHPHFHGRVAYQVIGGAFGPIIIEEQTKVGWTQKGKDLDPAIWTFLTDRSIERVLSAYNELGTRIGNGNPSGAVLSINANQWHRLRIVHGKPECVTGTTAFLESSGALLTWNTVTGPQCEIYEIAADGIYYNRVPYLRWEPNGATSTYQFSVHGAERLDLAVRCLTTGTFRIEYDGGAVAQFTVNPAVVATTAAQQVTAAATPFAAKGKQQWVPVRAPFIKELRPGYPAYAKEIQTIAAPFTIHVGFDGINGKLFDPAVPMVSAQYGPQIAYDYLFQNTGPHPTHMHQQHFQIITPGGCGPLKEGEWYDTITAVGADSCLVRTRFVEFSGPTIIHCHVLDHEDMGIMSWIDVPMYAPGSFEASAAYRNVTQPAACCVPRTDTSGKEICRYIPACGSNIGANTCNQPCIGVANTCTKGYSCTVSGTCVQLLTGYSANGNGDAAAGETCSTPVYPFVVMGVGLAVAAVAVIAAVVIVRQRAGGYSTILIEEMKQDAVHLPSRNYSPFPGSLSPAPATAQAVSPMVAV